MWDIVLMTRNVFALSDETESALISTGNRLISIVKGPRKSVYAIT